MKPLTSQQIRGTWGTVLLPINADESIDYARLGAEIDTLIAAGVAGLYTNGTAGEFHTQTEDEFLIRLRTRSLARDLRAERP